MSDEQHMILLAACIRCGTLFAGDPDTVPCVWINTQTGCPLRPDTTPITPGEPNTAREPLCEACAPIIRASVGKPQPLHELFPQAHIHRRQAPD
jgi:hypothetical protein